MYTLSFLSPWYLLLLLLVPWMAWHTWRRLRVLGPGRRVLALLLRAAVLTLLVTALAEVQFVRRSDRLTVFYLLDQSLSIPVGLRQEMLGVVNAAVAKHRQRSDRVGVIVFGRDAAIESPPLDDSTLLPPRVESPFDPEHTNLAAAMRLAQASFPEDAAKRVVIVSDGNQNLGDAADQARQLAAASIGIDVLAVRYRHRAEVAVERLVLPPDIRRGTPFELKAVVTNTADAADGQGGVVRGRLEFRRLRDNQPVVLNPQPEQQRVELTPGKHVFGVRQQIDAPDFYSYEARFIPDRPDDDALPQNNRATAFTHIRGRGQVLLIESRQSPARYDLLAEQLRRQDLEVTLRSSDQCFSSLAELQSFDTVILADTPRDDFSDAQIQMLVRNTQQLGAGLVMLGGPNSFGAGGWHNTELEEALPVDFQVKNLKIVPRGTLVMVIDKSGSMTGPKIEICKGAAIEAAKVLNPTDQVAVVAFDTQAMVICPLQSAGDVGLLARRVARLAADGGTDMNPGMRTGYEILRKADSSVKHMIVLTDGQTTGSGYPQLAAQMKNSNITTSCVAVGGDADQNLMTEVARAGGGKSYVVTNAQMIPRIFQREARRVTRPLIYEDPKGLVPQVRYPHEMLKGFDGPLPPVMGYVLTSKKEHPLVETALVCPKPADNQTNTLLATWTYGLGRTVAFTSDANERWTGPWTRWDNYGKFFGQLVRWSMRPSGDTGKFGISTDLADGQVRVVVTALDKDDQFLNFLDILATAVAPNLQSIPVKLEQSAPGRYVGTFPAADAGSYLLLISPGPGKAPLRWGVNVPYSDEFRDRSTNETLLKELVAVVPAGGKAGQWQGSLEGPLQAALLAVNPFRHDLPAAHSSQDVWHYLLLVASWVFLADVFVRRVQVNFAWLPPLWARVVDRVRGRRSAAPVEETIDRLRSRKAAVAQQLDQARAATRFEPAALPPSIASEEILSAPDAATSAAAEASAGPKMGAPDVAKEESYTERLLKAKKKVWEDRP